METPDAPAPRAGPASMRPAMDVGSAMRGRIPVTDTTEITAAPSGAGDAGRRTGSLSALRLPQLQALASELGLSGTAKMRKSDLVEAITARRQGAAPRAGPLNRRSSAPRRATAPTSSTAGRPRLRSERRWSGTGQRARARRRPSGRRNAHGRRTARQCPEQRRGRHAPRPVARRARRASAAPSRVRAATSRAPATTRQPPSAGRPPAAGATASSRVTASRQASWNGT